ncbi:DNA glycosylase [Mycena albidolilacea]|uniref:DNA glycosylase n=1 Tax=Mycena albidolilacea TaxID=1033008 RepID=A0AAD7F248_9AGAR|nr:DNA glycosylase [Mycena albidolilacea]
MPQTPPRKRRSDIVSPYFSPKKTSDRKTPPSLSGDRLHERLIQLKPCLIQESVADDPWKLLVAVTLLNKTAGKLAIPVFWSIVKAWPTAWALSQAPEPEIVTLIRPLGTQNIRAKRLIDLSRAYLQDPPSLRDQRPSRAVGPPVSPRKREKYPPTPISHLPGAGVYALDSYRIFCSGPASQEWKDVNPSDKVLIRYLKWKWAVMENKQWKPGSGVIGTADFPYIEDLISELERYSTDKDSNAGKCILC